MSCSVISAKAPSIFSVSVDVEPKSEKLHNITAVALFAIAGLAIASTCSRLEDRVVWSFIVCSVALRLIFAILFEERSQSQNKINDKYIKNTSDVWAPFVRKMKEQKSRLVEKQTRVWVGEKSGEFQKIKLAIKNKDENICGTRPYEPGCKGLDKDFHAVVGKRVVQKPSLDTQPHAAVGGGVQLGKEEHAEVGTR